MPPKKPTSSSSDSADTHNDSITDRFESMLLRVTKSLTDSFNSCVEKLIVSLEQKMTLRLDVHAGEVFEANKRVDELDKRCRDLHAENGALRDSIKGLTTRIETLTLSTDDLQQYSRSDNLLLHGIPLPTDGTKEDDLRQVVLGAFNRYLPGMNVTEDCISTAHRIASRPHNVSSNGSTPARAPKPPAIVIRFTQRAVKNRVLANRRKLKGMSISLTEQLTARRMQLLKKASDLATAHKVQSAWSHDGKILVKTHTNRTIQILTDTDLIQFNI
jgi:hypothetical protein